MVTGLALGLVHGVKWRLVDAVIRAACGRCADDIVVDVALGLWTAVQGALPSHQVVDIRVVGLLVIGHELSKQLLVDARVQLKLDVVHCGHGGLAFFRLLIRLGRVHLIAAVQVDW